MNDYEGIGRQTLERERRRGFRRWRFVSLRWRAWRELGRTVRAATRASALFLTIAGVLLSIAGLVLAFRDQMLADATAWLWLVLSILLLAFLASGLLVLRMLPAQELAGFLIHGRRTDEILETIALRIHRLASAFVNETAKGQDLPLRLLDRCQRRGGDKDRLIAQAAARVHAIEVLFRSEDINFRRIEALKQRAAVELGLSQRSLGDHILQFSPAMFRIGVEKYLRNLREMIELTQATDFEDADARRFRGLMEQNRRLEEDCRDRATIQELLLRFRDMHPEICSLASTRSTSGSLQAYSRALSELASRQSDRLAARSWRRGWRSWSGSVEDPVYIETYERFLFLFRCQRAHPGFDLHTLLTQAVDRMSTRGLKDHFEEDVVKDLATAMRALEWRGMGRLARHAPAGRGNEDPQHSKRYIKRLLSMRQLHRYFNRIVSLSREAMKSPFAQLLGAWCHRREAEAAVYVVTLGYSKTVRELIRHGLAAPTAGVRAGKADGRPRLYQLLSDQPDQLDARLMTWELRDSRSRQPVNLAAGSGEMLVSLTRRGDRVLFLLGAEAIDEEGRVVHPRSVLEQLEPALEGLTEAGVHSIAVVVAEAFKRHRASFSRGPLYRGYLERVGIYDPPLVHIVLTDDGMQPIDWKKVVAERLRSFRRARPSEPH